jgi:hypothetical protein
VKFHAQLLPFALLAFALSPSHAQQSSLVPMQPQPRTDKFGNEWYVEQNGQLSRHSGGNSMLNNAMTLTIGSEQFYCNQPMGTTDGKEIVLMAGQPMQGLQVTRNLRFMEKEGGMRYLDTITNPTGNDINATVELRNTFSGQVKSILTNTGRPNQGSLEKDETSLAAVPSTANMSSYIFTVCGPQSAAKPRVTTQNQYQLSFFHSVTVPAGKSVALLHTVTQAKLSLRPDAADLEKVLKPFTLSRQLKELPKGSAALVVNLRSGGGGPLDVAAWFPDELLGVKRETMDVLAIGEGTRLRGRASCAKLTLEHERGKVVVPWEQVIALSGQRYEGGVSHVYLADGQVLRGKLQAEELKLTLSTGLPMELKMETLDRLVLGSLGTPAEWPKQVAALVEMSQGERLALPDLNGVSLTLATTWGTRTVPLSDLAGLVTDAEDSPTPLLTLRDGSRLRVFLGAQSSLPVKTLLFGAQTLDTTRIKAVAVAAAQNSTNADSVEEEEPQLPYVDLAGDQRLVAPLADSIVTLITSGGPVPIESGSIKELRNLLDESPKVGLEDAPWFQVELWGGGSVLGQLRESTLRFRVGDSDWMVPGRELIRVSNPAPKIADGTLNRIAQLIRDLGHDDWKVREKASGELRTLGEMARSSLQEAFKQSEDPEVKHRLENLLSELD